MDSLYCKVCGNSSARVVVTTPQAMPGSIVSYARVVCFCGMRGKKFDDWDKPDFMATAANDWRKLHGERKEVRDG